MPLRELLSLNEALLPPWYYTAFPDLTTSGVSSSDMIVGCLAKGTGGSGFGGIGGFSSEGGFGFGAHDGFGPPPQPPPASYRSPSSPPPPSGLAQYPPASCPPPPHSSSPPPMAGAVFHAPPLPPPAMTLPLCPAEPTDDMTDQCHPPPLLLTFSFVAHRSFTSPLALRTSHLMPAASLSPLVQILHM